MENESDGNLTFIGALIDAAAEGDSSVPLTTEGSEDVATGEQPAYYNGSGTNHAYNMWH